MILLSHFPEARVRARNSQSLDSDENGPGRDVEVFNDQSASW